MVKRRGIEKSLTAMRGYEQKTLIAEKEDSGKTMAANPQPIANSRRITGETVPLPDHGQMMLQIEIH